MKKGTSKLKEIAEQAHKWGEPYSVAFASTSNSGTSSSRRNAAATQDRTDKYVNIENGLVPYRFATGTKNKSGMNVREAVVLCQKCYYNFATFRNVIDLMTEFSIGNIYYTGGNKKSQDFFSALFKKINLWDLQDRWFREYFRSGNVFTFRFDGTLNDFSVNQIIQTFGAVNTTNPQIPVRYIILNPADVQIQGSISFAVGRYFKVISDYELERLRSPQTDEDKEVLQSLPPEAQRQIKQGGVATIILPLERDKVSAAFYKKQDYEPFAVPMGFPVLADINWKEELKRMDMAIARTMQQAILLITMGAEPEKGGINPQAMNAMRQIFTNESVGRVLVSDYTTEAKFIVPEIGDLLDPKKYAQVDKDIENGLNNILIGDAKFANTSVKVQIFLERLRQARQCFLENFLYPEIRRISKDLGFKSYPTPNFEDSNLKDELEYAKVYTQMASFGILTPEEGILAVQTGRLPTPEESAASQERLQAHKDKGYYQPLVGGPQDHLEQATTVQSMKPIPNSKIAGRKGRPSGSKSPKRLKPIGGSFSLKKVTNNLILASNLRNKVEEILKKKNKLDDLTPENEEVCDKITSIILANEESSEWENSKMIKAYLESPIDKNVDRVEAIQKIALAHQVDDYLASILYISQK